MTKNVHKYLVRISVASGWLMSMAGCNVAMNPASPVDLSTPLTDLAMFIQRFAREALAAFLL